MKKIILLTIMAIVLICGQSNAAEYIPPAGITAPSFGIEETYRIYDIPANRNSSLTYNQNVEGGYYTHYIDNTNSNATDTDNLYGTATVPRLTIPTTLEEGSVVELHGGPYAETSGDHGQPYLVASGSKEKPIFVKGYNNENKTEFNDYFRFRGSYIIVENIIFKGEYPAGLTIMAPCNHISVRKTEVTGLNHINQGNTFSLSPSGDDTVDFNENIVFYNNYFHDNGYPAASTEYLHNDFQISGNSREVWILDNTLLNGSEDAIHVIYYHDAKFIPDGVYIGHNTIGHYTENAIDVKPSRNVIISQNTFYGYKVADIPPDDGSDGSAVCFNYESGAPQGQTIENHYFIFNTVHNSNIGVRTEYNPVILGNQFYDINTTAVRLNGNTTTIPAYIINNTILGAKYGIFHSRGAMFYAYNNILINSSIGHIKYTTAGDRDIKNNLFLNPDGMVHVWVGGSGAKEYIGLTNLYESFKIKNCWEAVSDLISIDPNSTNFLKLKADSISVDKGVITGPLEDVYNNFYNAFGINLPSIDIDGNLRPQGTTWDLGAYEYIGSTLPQIPTGLKIVK